MGATLKIRHALLGALVALSLFGCATPYGSSGITGGYSETQIDDATWRVSFYGNGFTTRETVQTFWLYRCAELTLEKGYDGFELASNVRLISNVRPANDGAVAIPAHGGGAHFIYIPVYIPNMPKPYMTAQIHMIKQPFTANPPNSFDAAALRQTLEPLVKLKLCNNNVCPHPHTYLGAPQPSRPGEQDQSQTRHSSGT